MTVLRCCAAIATVLWSGTATAEPATLELIAAGLDFPSNIIAQNEHRILVLEKDLGVIRTIADGQLEPIPFLDIHDRLISVPRGEEGLLSAALPPGFLKDAAIYVTYIARDAKLRLSRFLVDGGKALAESEEILLALDRDNRMHHCGHIVFHPSDGLLYLCVGDTQNNRVGEVHRSIPPVAQDLERPLGKIIRLDVAAAPLQHSPGPAAVAAAPASAGELWAYGLRNPWRFTFDPATGDAFIPDIGRYHWEELNYRPAAAQGLLNYGWPLAEANACSLECSAGELVWPIYQYPTRNDDPEHKPTCAIIGGVVYRGPDAPAWHGVYVFGDLCSGEIWALRNPAAAPELRRLADTDLQITAIGRDGRGEIVLTDGAGGAVYRLGLPAMGKNGWDPVPRLTDDMLRQAARTGYGRAREQLGAILGRRTYQLADQLTRAVSWLRSWF